MPAPHNTRHSILSLFSFSITLSMSLSRLYDRLFLSQASTSSLHRLPPPLSRSFRFFLSLAFIHLPNLVLWLAFNECILNKSTQSCGHKQTHCSLLTHCYPALQTFTFFGKLLACQMFRLQQVSSHMVENNFQQRTLKRNNGNKHA